MADSFELMSYRSALLQGPKNHKERQNNSQLIVQVIFTHLRTGHSNLNHTLHIIGKHNTGLCDVCLIEETVEHVLKKCK